MIVRGPPPNEPRRNRHSRINMRGRLGDPIHTATFARSRRRWADFVRAAIQAQHERLQADLRAAGLKATVSAIVAAAIGELLKLPVKDVAASIHRQQKKKA